MRFEVDVNGRIKEVKVQRVRGRFMVSVDGREHMVDAARVNGQILSLLIEQILPDVTGRPDSGSQVVRSYEVAIAPAGHNGLLTVQVGSAPIVVALNGRRQRRHRDNSAHGPSGP